LVRWVLTVIRIARYSVLTFKYTM